MQLDQKAMEAVKREIQRFHRNSCYPEALEVELEVAAKRILQAVQPVPVVTEDAHQFKNFHRLLCERFGYCHDEKDWRRDQVSLIEHIATLTSNTITESVDE